MSNDNKLEKLLQKSETIEITTFEVKNSTTNIFSDVVEFLRRKSEVYLKLEKQVYEFTPKMICEIFEVNSSKYYADLFWTHSNNEKNLKANPKNEVLFASTRRSVYRLATKEEIAVASRKVKEMKVS